MDQYTEKYTEGREALCASVEMTFLTSSERTCDSKFLLDA